MRSRAAVSEKEGHSSEFGLSATVRGSQRGEEKRFELTTRSGKPKNTLWESGKRPVLKEEEAVSASHSPERW